MKNYLKTKRLGIVGCGAIGTMVTKHLIQKSSAFKVVALFDQNFQAAYQLANSLKSVPRVCNSLNDLVDNCEWILEAAAVSAVLPTARVALKNHIPLIVMSVGGFFLNRTQIIKLANQYQTKVYIPSGALAGIDGVRSAQQIGRITKVEIISTKNENGLKGAPGFSPKYLRNLEIRKKPCYIFQGGVKQAIDRFPKNVNVAATLASAAKFTKQAKVKVVLDPKIKVNQHEIRIEGSFGKLHSVTQNVPSTLNPKTSALAIQSVLALFERLESYVEIGN
jgi:aspartate dehydrogenase